MLADGKVVLGLPLAFQEALEANRTQGGDRRFAGKLVLVPRAQLLFELEQLAQVVLYLLQHALANEEVADAAGGNAKNAGHDLRVVLGRFSG